MPVDDLELDAPSRRRAPKKDEGSKAGVIFAAVGGLALLGGGIAFAASRKKKGKKPVGELPGGQPPGDEQPPPPAGNALQFDLETGWGGIPMDVRKKLARLELASGIPGLARAGGVKLWQVYRAGQAIVPAAQAAQLAAAAPDLCRFCVNPADGPDSAALVDAGLANGWPAPKDVAGWRAASYGLGDILGGTAVWQGIEDAALGDGKYDRTKLPLIDLDAGPAMARWDVQLWLVATLVWQYLSGPQYTVLVPGPQAAQGNAWETWGNIFAAYANPSAYVKGQALDEKQRYLARAVEIGIDLAQVAYPWPPGKSYKHPTGFSPWQVWQRLQSYMLRDVEHVAGPPKDEAPPIKDPPANEVALLQPLQGGLAARAVPTALKGEEPGPLVLYFHGRSATESQLLPLVPATLQARAFLLRGLPGGENGTYRWFSGELGGAGPALTAMRDDLVQAVRQLAKEARATRVVAVGYDQGAAVALFLGSLGAVDGAISMAGGLPTPLRPARPSQAVCHLVHGEADPVVPVALGQSTAMALATIGMVASFKALAGTGHELTSLADAALPMLPTLLVPTAEPGFHLTDTCGLVVDDLGQAVRHVVPAVLAAAQTQGGWGGPLPLEVIRTAILEVTTKDDPACALAPIVPTSKEDAQRLYLLARALYRAVVLRGLLGLPEAVAALAGARAEAEAKGIPVADLPELGL